MKGNVCVIIPAYRKFELVERALNSVLAQSLQPQEILVIDDASGNGLAQQVAQAFPAVRVYELEQNRGPAGARNFALDKAKASLIAFLDHDDAWTPEYLERQVWTLQNRGAVMSVTDCIHLPVGHPARYCSAAPEKQFGSALQHLMRQGLVLSLSQVVVRRKNAEDVGFFDAGLRIAHDHDFYLRLLQTGSMAHVPLPLVMKHEQPTSVSRNPGLLVDEVLRVLDRFFDRPENVEYRPLRRSAKADYLAGLAGTLLLHGGGRIRAADLLARALMQDPGAAIRSIGRRIRRKLANRRQQV
jgi:glycosyltransferase involved in cell wall biosynthesis